MSVKCMYSLLDKMLLSLSCSNLSGHVNQNAKGMKGISYSNIKTEDVYPGNRKHVSRYKPYRTTILRRYRKMARQPYESENLDLMKKDINQLKSYKHTDKANPIYRSLYSYKKSYYKFKCFDKKIRKSFHSFNEFEMNQLSRKVASFRLNKTSKDKIMWPPLYKYKGNVEKKPKPQTPHPQGRNRLVLKLTTKSYPAEILQPIYPTKVHAETMIPNQVNVRVAEMRKDMKRKEDSNKDNKAVDKKEEEAQKVSREEVDNLKMKIKLHKQSNVSLDSINRLCYKLENITDKKPESIVHYLKSSLKRELEELKAAAPNKYRELMKQNKFNQFKLDMHITSERLREITKDSSRFSNNKPETNKMKNVPTVISKNKDKEPKVLEESGNEEIVEVPASPAQLIQSSNSGQSILLTKKPLNKTIARAFSTQNFFDSDAETSLSLKIDDKPTDIASSCETQGKYARYINSTLNNKKVLKYMMEKHKVYLESKSKKDKFKSERFKLDTKDFSTVQNFTDHKFLSVTAGREKMLNIKLKELKTRLKSYQSAKTIQPIFEAKQTTLQTTEPITSVVKPEELHNNEIEHVKSEIVSIPKGLFNSQGMSLLTTRRFYSTSTKGKEGTFKKIAENKMAYQPLYLYKNEIKNCDEPTKSNCLLNERTIVNQSLTFDRGNTTRIKVNLDNLTCASQIKINLDKLDDLKLGRTTVPTTSATFLQPIHFASKNEPLSKLKKNVLQLKKLIHEKLGKDYGDTNKVCEKPYAITAPKKIEYKPLFSPPCSIKTTETISEMTSPCTCEKSVSSEDILTDKIEKSCKTDSPMDLKDPCVEERKANELTSNLNRQNEKSLDSWKMQIRETVFNNNNNNKVDNSMINKRSGILLNHADVSFPTKETGFFSGGLKLAPPCEFDGSNLPNSKQEKVETKECGTNLSKIETSNGQKSQNECKVQVKNNTSSESRASSSCTEPTVIKPKRLETSEKLVNPKLLQEIRTEIQKSYEKSLQDITSEVLKSNESQAKSKEPKIVLEGNMSSSERSRCPHVKRIDNNNLRKIKSLEGVNRLFEELYDSSKKEVAQLSSRSLDRLDNKPYLSKFDNLMNKIADSIYNREPPKSQKSFSKDDAKKNLSSIISKINAPLPPWMKSVFEKKKYTFNNSNIIDCRDKSNIKLEISGPSGNVALKLTRNSKNGSLQATLSLPNCVPSHNASSNKETSWLDKRLKANAFNKQTPKLSSITLIKKDNSSGALDKDSLLLIGEKKIATSPKEGKPSLKSKEVESSKSCTSVETKGPSDQTAKKEERVHKGEAIKSNEECPNTPKPIKALKQNEKVDGCDKQAVSKIDETLKPTPSVKIENKQNVEMSEGTCQSKSEVTPKSSKSEVNLKKNVVPKSSSTETSDKTCPAISAKPAHAEIKSETKKIKCTDEKPTELPKNEEQVCSHQESSRPPSPINSKTDIQECLPRTSIEKSTPMMSLCTVRQRIKPVNPGKRKTRPIPAEDKSEPCNNEMYMPPQINSSDKTEESSKTCSKECSKSGKKQVFNAAAIKASDIPNKMFHIQQPVLKCFIVPDGNLCPLTPEKSSSCSSLPTGLKSITKNSANKKMNNRKSCLNMAKEEIEKNIPVQKNVIYPRSRSKSPERLMKYEQVECKENEVLIDEHGFESDFTPDIPTVTPAKSQVTLFDTKSISVSGPETDDFTKKLKLPCLSTEYEKTWFTEAGLNNTRPTTNNYYYKISDMFFPKM